MFWKFIYGLTNFVSRYFGTWIFRIIAFFVCAVYFLSNSERRGESLRFYRVLYPGKKKFFYYSCSWKQYRNFSNLFVDRFIHSNFGKISYQSEGWEYFLEAQREGRGGIILMSHMGNWDVAAQLFSENDLNLLIYMGKKQKEQMEDIYRDNMADSGVRFIAVEENSSDPVSILEGINFLKQGGFISLTGDRIWQKEQKAVPVDFMGYRAFLPESPYQIALVSRAPIFVFFSHRIDDTHYHFSCSPPLYLEKVKRADRREAIEKTAQSYAKLLEAHVSEYPFEWYHFEKFLHEELQNQ